MFASRTDGGQQLAKRLRARGDRDVVVLGLPRGGVPVAAIVAEALDAPLDVLLVRKLGAPFQPELAMGAVGEGGVVVLNDEVVRLGRISAGDVREATRSAQLELDRRARLYRGPRPAALITGRAVVLVDDGMATGSTARAACRVARQRGAEWVILAAPVGSPDTTGRFRREADEVVLLETPAWFEAVGQAYRDFRPTTDGEVVALLAAAHQRFGGGQ